VGVLNAHGFFFERFEYGTGYAEIFKKNIPMDNAGLQAGFWIGEAGLR